MNKAFGDLELNKEIDLDTIIYKRICDNDGPFCSRNYERQKTAFCLNQNLEMVAGEI
jgi:hypothetical protein